MRVAVMAAGSRGDVAPYTGLGHGLAQVGHEVTLVTYACFEPLVAPTGLGFHPLPGDPHGEPAPAHGKGPHRGRAGVGERARVIPAFRALVHQMVDDLVKAAEASDVILVSRLIGPLGHTIAQGLGLPSMGVYVQPHAATGEFVAPMIGFRSWGRTGNRLSGLAVNAVIDQILAPAVRDLRVRLGLPRCRTAAARRARERQDWPIHHGYSPLVVPRPRDWRPGLTVVGYWWPYDTPGAPLPTPLDDFLAAGPPPVFVCMGSSAVPDIDRLSETVTRALRAAGLRGVIQRGWGGLRIDGDDMLTIDEVPYATLFPRVAAVVHHAGAGTTAAALRAGIPAVPIPVEPDNAFWSARLTALGVAPGFIPVRRLTTDALTAALRRLATTPSYTHRARALAARLRQEDGVTPVAVALDALPPR